MTRAFYISFIAFLFIALLDILSYRTGDPVQSRKLLLEYAESNFNTLRENILNEDFLQLLTSDSLSSSALNRLRKQESEYEHQQTSIQLRKADSLIFWSGLTTSNAFCKSYKKADYKLKICLEYFDDDGILKQNINQKAGIAHRLILTNEQSTETHSWNSYKLDGGIAYRSYRLNNLLITAYIFFALILIWLCFHTGKLWPIILLFISRSALLFFDGWHERLSHSSLSLGLFDWQSYGNIDLLLDMFIVFCILSFLSSNKLSLKRQHFNIEAIMRGVLLVLLITSQIRLIQHVALCNSFNITINDISTINIPEIIIFVSLALLLTGVFIYAVSYLQKLKAQLEKIRYYLVNLAFIAGIFVLSQLFGLELKALYLSLFLFCFFLLIDLFLDIRQKSVTWIIWWAIFFGIFLSALFFNYDIKRQIDTRQVYLENLFLDVDDKLVSTTLESGICDSIMTAFSKLIVLPEEARYSRSDIRNYLLNRFDLDFISFDVIKKNGKHIFSNWPGSERLIQINPTYYFDEISNILWHEDIREQQTLLVGYRVKLPETRSFPLCILKNGKVFSFGLDPSRDELRLMEGMTGKLQSAGSRVIIKYESASGTKAFTIKEFESLVKPIALFSYLFTLFIILFIIIGSLSAYIDILPTDWPLKYKQFESLNARIQTALILVILLSFILIALVTSSFLKNFIQSKNNQFLSEKIESVSRDLNLKINIAESAGEAITIANNFQSEIEGVHSVKLDFISIEEPNLDIRYFPFAYFKKQDYPKAFSEQSGADTYTSYIPLEYNEQYIGFIRMNELSDSVRGFKVYDFLGSIFNVYVFLFLIASVLAIFIAKSITKPLSLLNQKLIGLKLGRRNELISWDQDDEVGSLINNYNNMVKQLESSVELLAKTERDNAWREMAKQVAHEIKNPLTPMRMYIQHLEKAVKQQPERAIEITKKISLTLLEQVENLTQIADSFSNFAELPQSSNEKIELNKVVELVHNLFRKRDDMEILMTEPIDPIFVYADKNQLIRILNNLVKNAIESIPAQRKGKIVLHLYSKDDKAIIKVTDNGAGIPPEMHDKIFQPKFTTKDSGSGLGLAIAQNMIESMNGRLYFKPEPLEGTSFFIELDIIRQNFEDMGKRITLD